MLNWLKDWYWSFYFEWEGFGLARWLPQPALRPLHMIVILDPGELPSPDSDS